MKRFHKWTALLSAALMVAALAGTAKAETQQESGLSQGEKPQLTYTNAPEAEYKEVNELVYATVPLNVRTGPGTDYSILGVLQVGASIRRIAIGSNGWSKVVYGGQTAYMATQYLSVTRPAGYTDHLDDTELKRQIAVANGLNRLDYTAESWETVSAALDKAVDAMGKNNQATADKAAQDLKAAIAALVRMDYSALEKALSDVEKLVESSQQNKLWEQLMRAAGNGSSLLTSGDQAAVDAAVSEISQLYSRLKTMIEEQKDPDVVIQENPVEVPPTDEYCNIAHHRGWSVDYCNIARHRVWPVLLCISLAVNVILITVIVSYTAKKKRNQRDDTPLVDYDIYDD